MNKYAKKSGRENPSSFEVVKYWARKGAKKGDKDLNSSNVSSDFSARETWILLVKRFTLPSCMCFSAKRLVLNTRDY